MKKLICVLLVSLISFAAAFAYNIEKIYDYSFSPDYTIRTTNENDYYHDANGQIKYYDTVLIIDHKSSTVYAWYYQTQNDALKKYRELINDYNSSYQIKNKLIPSLQDRISYLSTSDNGKWMYCTLDETPASDYLDIPNDDFFYILSDKILDEELFGRIMYYVMSSFEEPINYFEYIYSGASPREITEEGIIILLDNFIRTEENSNDIDHIIEELRALI
ncbi:MAG: hypothetical protein MJ179_08890 [Treponema sp.]|nr:hypothetical protein [Treponema sp.]